MSPTTPPGDCDRMRFQHAAFGPELGPDRHADDGDLDQALEQIHPAFQAEHALEAGRNRKLGEIRLELVGIEASGGLQHMAGQRWPAIITPMKGASTSARCSNSAARHRRQAGAIHAICSGCSRNMVSSLAMPSAVDWPNMAMAKVPPASSTKAVTSLDLTMSPDSRACSSRLAVGSSVCCDLSLIVCHELRGTSPSSRVVIEEQRDHRAQHRQHDDKAAENVDRHGDEEDLQLRHQLRQHAQRGIDREAEHQERRRQLKAQREGDETSRITSCAMSPVGRCRAGRHHLVAARDGADRQMMQVGGEDHHRAQQGQEIADHRALGVLGGIEGLGIGKADLGGDQEARHLQRAHDDARPWRRPARRR